MNPAESSTENPLSLPSLAALIRAVTRDSHGNRLRHFDNSPIFDEPLVAVADGDDPLFEEYKRVIGPHHFTPREMLELSQQTNRRSNDANHIPVRVVCWVLPITETTRRSNAIMSSGPSRRWAHTRYYGEKFNNELRRAVEQHVRKHGARAIAPVVSPLFESIRNTPDGPSSTWSERHALFAAGLGTFGLCDGFLTAAGKAMRCGSVVVDVPLPVAPRPYSSHREACVYFTKGTCGECLSRCPAGAIGPNGHDKGKCDRYQQETLRPLRKRYGVPITGCGLCQTGVPCESCLPT